MATYFSDHFEIEPAALDAYGAFNVSLITDLPLFIDPFLLFNSGKPEYRALHDEMIRYLVFLKNKAISTSVNPALLKAWYCFPEVKQNWLGFSQFGNRGSGLGMDFAVALHENLHRIFADFGAERITKGSHLEKVCLIRDGVGRDNISDFTTNLIKDFLYTYTQRFALAHLKESQRRRVAINGARFSYETERWVTDRYILPWVNGDYVILTPKDILTRDENWINRPDLIRDFEEIPTAIPDAQLRAQVSNYFERAIPRFRDKEPTQKDKAEAARRTILQFPALIDYYIRFKENRGDRAESTSTAKVYYSEQLFIRQLQQFQASLKRETGFYDTEGATYEEAHERLAYLKDVIENKGGHRIFYSGGKPIEREADLHVLYRLVWFGTPSDVSTEVNDGRGPADSKISRGAADKTIVEMKLAKNTHLRRNLEKQAEVYQRASDAQNTIKVIIYFTNEELLHLTPILSELKLLGHRDVILIDARNDNKPSGSKA
jgi:hypothetical protein